MKWKVYHLAKDQLSVKEEELVEEAPLYLKINGSLQKELLRTPTSLQEDKALIVGFCFTEGIIENKGDIVFLHVSYGNAEIETKKGGKMKKTADLTFHNKDKRVSAKDLLTCMNIMESRQQLRLRTKASHAAMLFSYDLTSMYMSEDVGRHNALDKVIGKALIDDNLQSIFMATLSSRISFEMAKKAAKAGIKVLMGISRPTSMAVLLANKIGMSIVTLGKNGELLIFSAKERIKECQKENLLG